MMKPKKSQSYAVVKKILLRNLTVWFSIPPIVPFDCPVKLDVPLVKLVAVVKECHTRIVNCISIFFRYSWHSNPSWVAGKGQMNFLLGVLPTSRGFFSLVFFGREEKPSEYQGKGAFADATWSRGLISLEIFKGMAPGIWGLFLESPGNFSGPKAIFKIKTFWIVAQLLAHKLVDFNSLNW